MKNYFNEKNLHSIDSKGRILLPKEIRENLKIKKGDVLHFVPNLSGPLYIEIRTAGQWKSYRDGLRDLEAGEKKKDSYRYATMLQESATVDGQGRVLIPQRIRELCKVADSVAVIDMDEYVEVWAKENLEQKYSDMVKAFKELNDRMF
jgi:MraZ protein